MQEYDSSMKISAIKRDVRERMMQEIQEYLQSKYAVCGQVSGNEIGVVTGIYRDDGFENETACIIKVTAKPFYFKTADTREIEAYDLKTEMKNYIDGVEE